jgi:hypothetical protein
VAARVIGDPDESARAVAAGSPVVLVGRDPAALSAAVSAARHDGRRESWLAVMVGDPEDPAVMAAATEMASELWPWAGAGTPAKAGPGP